MKAGDPSGELFDEDTEKQFARLCERDGHDVERVVDVPELGDGAKDPDVRAYARRENRIIVYHDDDHTQVPIDEHVGVFLIPEQLLSSFDHFRILSAVCESYPNRGSLQPVAYLTENWL
ncbi:DUF5615 family PIN-like protein [Halobaculum rubrum]|uniref:DUF5615 family PIN-like protein n=1 Tax=Halobaculum rubrum TaxID=2872158 RepID=UPI001CA392B7|nr:DUF5615 family PIN-like protein [Halobaculum rubrum]QZX98706.1 DUF5615 family PIN-like protein [Halobaculum rubrum]